MKVDNLLINAWLLLIRSQSPQSRKTLLRTNPEIFNLNQGLFHTRVHSYSLLSRCYYSPSGRCTGDESMHLRFWFFGLKNAFQLPLLIYNFFLQISPRFCLSNCRCLHKTAKKLHKSSNLQKSHHYQIFGLKNIDSTGT